MSPSVKRALFQTPTRRSKRVKTSTSMKTVMKVPKSMIPETKQYIASALAFSSSNYSYSSIPTDMSQGDSSEQFIGSKFRLMRLRVNYDWSALTLIEAVRISVVIPKDPTTAPVLSSASRQWDTTAFTVLHDMLLPKDPAVAAGTFDVTGPINCEMNSTGTSPLRNNVYIYVHSGTNGAALATDVTYSCWFTG